MKSSRLLLSLCAASLASFAAHAAEETTAPAAAPATTTEFSATVGLDGIKVHSPFLEKNNIVVSGWAEAGITYNPQSPTDNQNFGRLFDDRNDGPQFNQLVLNTERALGADKKEWDWGFKLQGLYGTDARYTRTLGLGDHYGSQSMQVDLVEAYGSLHAPVLTEGGVDFKVGKFATCCGLETIDPRANFFYSHSYIFNFGPFTHTGILSTTHLPEGFDLYAGVDRGAAPVSLDDNNSAGAFHGGIGYTAEKYSVLAATHIGPETNNNSRDLRSFTNVVLIIKASDKLTLSTDASYMQDNVGAGAKAYGLAQYATYTLTDTLSVGVRAEIFRDQDGFFVSQQRENDNFINGVNNEPNAAYVAGNKTTYGSLTLGVNWKAMPNLVIRPEVRYDHAFSNDAPFNTSGAERQGTVAVDAIFTF